MQGIKYPSLYDGILANGNRRKASKKGLKLAVADNPSRVVIVATSVFGNEYGGRLSDAPPATYTVVGPDAYTDRAWFASILVRGNGTYLVK